MFNKIRDIYKNITRKYGFTDYFFFPFKLNQPMPSSGLKIMEKCCAVLDSLGHKYYLATGTALGIYREGGFIKHDADIDIDLVGEELDFNAINSAFNKVGMKVGRKVTYKNKISQLVYYSSDNVVFDMCVWRVKGKYVYNYVPELFCRVRRHPLKYYENPDVITFNDRKYRIPAPTDEWLVLQYGKDWRIPKTYKGHWSKEVHDVFWDFDFSVMLIGLFKIFYDKACAALIILVEALNAFHSKAQ